jgi:hypothetical protein
VAVTFKIPPRPSEPYFFQCPCGAVYETSAPPPYECGVCERVGIMFAERSLGWITKEEYERHRKQP